MKEGFWVSGSNDRHLLSEYNERLILVPHSPEKLIRNAFSLACKHVGMPSFHQVSFFV